MTYNVDDKTSRVVSHLAARATFLLLAHRLVAMVCALVMACSLVGCTQTNVEDFPVEELPPSTELDEEAIMEAAQEAVADIEPTSDLDEHLLERFSCELDDTVVVDGDSAVLMAYVSNVNLPQAIEEAYAELGENAETIASIGELYQEGTDSDLFGTMEDLIYEHISACEDVVETTVRLRFSKHGNEWELDEESAQEFARAAYAGLE